MNKIKTKTHNANIGGFEMLTGVPFRNNLINKVLDNNGAIGSTMGDAFIIIEGYLYNFRPADGVESDIKDYIEARGNKSYQERFELFGLMVDFSYNDVLYEAYQSTREEGHKADKPKDTDQKKRRIAEIEQALEGAIKASKASRKLKVKDEYIAVAPPNFDIILEWDEGLLDRAVRYWKIAGSPLPPTIDEILLRDMTWDDACYEYRYALEFIEDETKRKKAGLI